MKRYIRAAETQDDFKIMLGQYKHRRDFNNADDAELADFLDELNNKGVAHDVYQHKTGGGCTVFYDDITGSSSCTVAAASGDNWGRVKKLLDDEFDRGVPDPIFDAGAKVGKKVLPLMDAVHQDLGVDFDGQFNYGDGIVEFVITGDDPELVVEGYDFRTFYRKLLGMIMEANNATNFKRKYKDYIKQLISSESNTDSGATNQARSEKWHDRSNEHPGWVYRDFESWSDDGHDFMVQLAADNVPYDFMGDGKGGVTVWYPDKSNVSSTTSVNAATIQRMTDNQLEHLLELADDMLYQVYDNYRYDDYTKEDIIQMVIEQVILVITEMDDDGVYEELIPFASTSNRQFMKNLKEYVGEMCDTLEWRY